MIQQFLRGLLGYCPHCGQGRFTQGLFGTREACSHCGLRFYSGPGDFTGAAAIAYGVVSIPILLFGLLLVVVSELSLVSIMAIGLGLTLLLGIATHQPIKGLWLAFLLNNGAIHPPDGGG
jgi:uncharacterized protein (DUF983 family)